MSDKTPEREYLPGVQVELRRDEVRSWSGSVLSAAAPRMIVTLPEIEATDVVFDGQGVKQATVYRGRYSHQEARILAAALDCEVIVK